MHLPPNTESDAHPYLRAATAGLRHHTGGTAGPADRAYLDTLHAHLAAVHQLVEQLADVSRPPHPTAGRHLASARLRLWQATAAVHDAFHSVPPTADADGEECHPEHLPDGPLVLTICQRHLAAGHTVRRETTPTDLSTPHARRTTSCTV